MTSPAGIDPRGPRFAAAITSVLLLVATVLGLLGISGQQLTQTTDYVEGAEQTVPPSQTWWALSEATVAQRASDPAFLLTAVIALLFLWAVLSPRAHPWAILFRTLIRPRLKPPTELEDPRPPRFAQGVGLFVVTIGLVLHLLGVPYALPIATAAAFVAAFLNAAFAFCLGCQLYLFLQRAGVLGRERTAA